MISTEVVRGRHAYLEQPGLFALSGLDQLRAFVEARVPAPPVQRLTGLSIVDVGLGSSTWEMPASPWWLTATGLFPGGALAFASDGALACAIYSAVPAGVAVVTSSISMSFVRPATPASERIRARGSTIHVGRQQGLSEVLVEDDGGSLLAHATSRCLLRPIPFEPPPPPGDFPVVASDDEGSDPFRRPVEGGPIPQARWNDTPGRELARMLLDHELERPPVCHLTGWRLRDTGDGTAACSMPASPWFSTALGTFYGGALALLADAAIGVAITTTLPAGTSFGTLDLKVDFLRPVTPDDRELLARAAVARRGRTVAVTTATVDDADGRTVAMATSSAMILPDRPWVAPEDETQRDGPQPGAASSGGLPRIPGP